jgi:hypothetical protein
MLNNKYVYTIGFVLSLLYASNLSAADLCQCSVLVFYGDDGSAEENFGEPIEFTSEEDCSSHCEKYGKAQIRGEKVSN